MGGWGCREGKLKRGGEIHGRERGSHCGHVRKSVMRKSQMETVGEAEGRGEKRVSFPLQFALLTAGKLISLNQNSDEATLQFKTFQGSGLLTSRGLSTKKCWEPCKTHRKYG